MSRDESSLSGHWRRRIFRLVCRLNFGWWLDRFLLLFLALSFVCMCALLLGRRQGWSETEIWRIFALGLVPMGLGAFFWARRHFESRASARVRLEYALRLNNRLTAAASGIGSWPQKLEQLPEVLQWRWQRVLSMGLAACLLLLAGAYVPIHPEKRKISASASKPPVLEQLESWMETLEQSELVEEKTLEELKQQVEQLAGNPPDEWYSHSNLEASDHLREQLQNKIKALQGDLQTAAGALEKMQQENPSLSESQMAQLSGKLAEALQSAQTGQLPLNAKFMENLPEIDPSKLKAMSPGKARELMDRLKKGEGVTKKLGAGEGDPVAVLAMLEMGDGSPKGWGVDRGPGILPVSLSPTPSDVGSTQVESVSNEDLSRATMGETIGISQGEHEKIDYAGPAGGGTSTQGSGGEAVWVNQLTPQEQAQVKSFFK